MVNKKKIILIVSSILLITILVVSFTSCLKIGLKEKNVVARIEEEGGTYEYLRTSPITGNSVTAHSIDAIILARLNVDEAEQEVYIIYCGDDATAEWVKNQADEYLVKMRGEQAELQRQIDAGEKFIEFEHVVDYEHWISYEYDRCIMCGYSKALAIIRTY